MSGTRVSFRSEKEKKHTICISPLIGSYDFTILVLRFVLVIFVLRLEEDHLQPEWYKKVKFCGV